MSGCATVRFLRSSSLRRTLTTVIIAVGSSIVLALAGCANPGGIESAAKLATPASLGAAAEPVALVPTEWWRAFGDPVLVGLIERATAGSPTLRVAAARSARSAANVDAAHAAKGPQLGLGVDVTRQHFTENGIYPKPIAGSNRDIATAQLNGSWELDFFGRNRAQLDAAIGTSRAAAADAAAARVLLAVNVTRNYVQLARLLEQREILERTLGQRQEILSLIRQRVGAGLDTAVEQRQGEGALPETRQQIESIDEQIALVRHALAALLAEPPDRFDALAPRLSSLRAVEVPEVVPADLVGRRADIVAARWRVEAASGDVAAARAQFYPNVNLSAFVGLSSLGLDRLLRSGSAQYGAGPAIRLPIFDAGRLRAGLRGRSADLDVAVESYNATLVDAIHDVADQMSSVRSVERQWREQQAAARSAESAYDLSTQRYKAGLGT
ncbi:MAG: efflux transporter outer membrane subunit, partial [Caldimonas sp.]